MAKQKPIHAKDYISELLDLLKLQEIVIYSLEKEINRLEDELKSKDVLQ